MTIRYSATAGRFIGPGGFVSNSRGMKSSVGRAQFESAEAAAFAGIQSLDTINATLAARSATPEQILKDISETLFETPRQKDFLHIGLPLYEPVEGIEVDSDFDNLKDYFDDFLDEYDDIIDEDDTYSEPTGGAR